jgi:hypothetical protein
MSDEKTVLARRFLKISRDDLNASRILNERGIYALAVFHLQQAVEKATKVQCLLSGIVTHEEIRRIRHESLRGQQIIASKFSRFIRTLAQANPKLDVVLRLDELMGKKRRLEIAKLNATEIDVVLSACDHQAKSTDLPRLLAKDRLESILMRMKRDRLDLEISDGDAKAVLDAFEKLTPALASAVENFAFLYVASAITFPHAVSTRYPGGEMNPWDYNESLGIVNRLPELVKRFDKVIESLDTQLNRNLG